MFGKKKKLTLREQKKNIVKAILKAMKNGDSAEIDRLEGNLQWLEKQIKKGEK